jgi:hypothetical protein
VGLVWGLSIWIWAVEKVVEKWGRSGVLLVGWAVEKWEERSWSELDTNYKCS